MLVKLAFQDVSNLDFHGGLSRQAELSVLRNVHNMQFPYPAILNYLNVSFLSSCLIKFHKASYLSPLQNSKAYRGQNGLWPLY